MGIGEKFSEAYRGFKARSNASDADMGINTEHPERTPISEIGLANGPLYHAFATEKDGVMGPRDEAVMRMQSFFRDHSDISPEDFAGKTVEEAREIIATRNEPEALAA